MWLATVQPSFGALLCSLRPSYDLGVWRNWPDKKEPRQLDFQKENPSKIPGSPCQWTYADGPGRKTVDTPPDRWGRSPDARSPDVSPKPETRPGLRWAWNLPRSAQVTDWSQSETAAALMLTWVSRVESRLCFVSIDKTTFRTARPNIRSAAYMEDSFPHRAYFRQMFGRNPCLWTCPTTTDLSFLSKTQVLGKGPTCVLSCTIPTLNRHLSNGMAEDRLLFPIWALRFYLERSMPWREHKRGACALCRSNQGINETLYHPQSPGGSGNDSGELHKFPYTSPWVPQG